METAKKRKKYLILEEQTKEKLRPNEQILATADIDPYRMMMIDLAIVVLIVVVMRFFYQYTILSLLGNLGAVFFAYFASEALNYGTNSFIMLTNCRILGVIKSREVNISLREISKCIDHGGQILILAKDGRHIELKNMRNQSQFYRTIMERLTAN